MLIAAVLAATLQAAAPPPLDCTDADHSAFNFWVGDWDVSPTGTDTVIAHSIISSVAGGCAIEENFHQTLSRAGTALDYHGSSFSIFDARGGGVWRQFYIDDTGGVSNLEGGVQNGDMVLEVDMPGGRRRMTVGLLPDGSVRQHGEVTMDGGATWTPGYDLTYRRR